ncbi:unnamed protein product [Prorocentrum cordatum]|uniref:cGMP-dependent protein kinase n=1 Tax=Prorocentrum cordatum TaxID=2364126 RepID=A0ABN9QGI3_9DINO|nr:unnamed protein product [Polarella glacialis]
MGVTLAVWVEGASGTGGLVHVGSREHLDVEVAALSRVARVAFRRAGDARMFVLPAGMVLTLGSEAAAPHDGDEPGSALSVDVGDVHCSARLEAPGAERGSGCASWPLLPGPLLWRLPRNGSDTELTVGSVLRMRQGDITLKVVSSRGTDWRGCPMARVRVVEGGLQAGKYFTGGSMYLAKIVPSKRAAKEAAAAHKRVGGGLLGSVRQLVRLEGFWQVETGAWLVIMEDFGETAREFFGRGRLLSAEDADRCAADLLAGVAAMHQHSLYHLALSPISVHLGRDGLGRLRLKLANLGVAECPSQPLPRNYTPPQGFLAPELAAPRRLRAVAEASVEGLGPGGKKEAPGELARLTAMLAEMSAQLGPLESLPLLPSLRPRGRGPQSDAAGPAAGAEEAERLARRERLQLLREFEMFLELPRASLDRLAREFEGPFQVPAGRVLFRTGDYLYFVLAGAIVTWRGRGRELSRYRRGDFLGEAALLGSTPSRRIFTASTRRGEGGCAVLRMRHSRVLPESPLVALVAPARWRFLSDTRVPLGEPRAADVFAAGALWVELVSTRGGSSLRVRRAASVEELRTLVSSFDIGNFYFTVQERRIVALITLLLRRASPGEALRCLEEAGGSGGGATEAGRPGHSHRERPEGPGERPPGGGPLAAAASAWDALQGNLRSAFELTPASEAASDAVLLGARARQSFQDQVDRLFNDVTYRRGQLYGEILGDIYGGLFAKDLLWMFREPSRTPKFPVLLVRDAEMGSLPARWYIAALAVFESELCRRTLPQGGFEIGAAVGRNRAVNFKRLWIDAFLGSFVKRLRVLVRIRLQRAKGSEVGWENLRGALKDAVLKGQSARRQVLLRKGALPTTVDQNAPAVLSMLPDQWVPDIGLHSPAASAGASSPACGAASAGGAGGGTCGRGSRPGTWRTCRASSWTTPAKESGSRGSSPPPWATRSPGTWA